MSGTSNHTTAAVLVTQRRGGYKDIPGIRYHYPKQRYHSRLLDLVGSLVLFYEPRRGGTSANSGGRQGFTSIAYLDHIEDDPEDATHAFAFFRFYVEFIRVVPLSETTLSPKSLQNAVRPIEIAEAERVVRYGLHEPHEQGLARQGLTDITELSTIETRMTRQIVFDKKVRDASFRFRVVEQAYQGRCALTGVRMTNGNGRAEVDAAHIRPVEHNGPDSVRNGLALMKSVHWAFDRGLVSLSDDGEILLVDRGIDDAVLRLFSDERRARLPLQEDLRPHGAFLNWHRTHVFKGAVG